MQSKNMALKTLKDAYYSHLKKKMRLIRENVK
jgi:hypothetical protein